MREQLRRLADQLKSLDDSFERDGEIPHYLAVRQGGAGEAVLEANAEGMVHLAAKLLDLAAQGRAGGHYHLDEQGMADHADPRLVFTYSPAT